MLIKIIKVRGKETVSMDDSLSEFTGRKNLLYPSGTKRVVLNFHVLPLTIGDQRRGCLRLNYVVQEAEIERLNGRDEDDRYWVNNWNDLKFLDYSIFSKRL